MILIDSNVLIDVLGVDQEWRGWSRAMLRRLAVDGRDLVIDTTVLAEIAGNAPDLPALTALLADLDIEVLLLDPDSAFSAGQAFRRYRRDRGQSGERAILADFLIGAHAVTSGASLLTRDPHFYRRYFPDLPLITPENQP